MNVDPLFVTDPSFYRPPGEHLYPMGSRSPDTERQMQQELLTAWVRRQQEGFRALRFVVGAEVVGRWSCRESNLKET